MFRTALFCLGLVVLAGCAAGPRGGVASLDVVAKSNYCGTASQDSDVHYFADPSAFEDWTEYRGINEFEPQLAQSNGIVVVEMGQRPTGGYNIALDRDSSSLTGGVLEIAMSWNAPRLDAAVSQALMAPCVAIRPPQAQLQSVRVVDQLGHARGQAQAR